MKILNVIEALLNCFYLVMEGVVSENGKNRTLSLR